MSLLARQNPLLENEYTSIHIGVVPHVSVSALGADDGPAGSFEKDPGCNFSIVGGRLVCGPKRPRRSRAVSASDAPGSSDHRHGCSRTDAWNAAIHLSTSRLGLVTRKKRAMQVIALIDEDDGRFGVAFPDFPGCTTIGASLDEA